MNFKKKSSKLIIFVILGVVFIGGVLIWQKWEEKITPPQKSQPEQSQEQQKKPFCSQSEKQGSSHILKGDTVYCDKQGRMWSETATSGLTWDKAVSYCDTLDYAGLQDWQLPGIEEKESFKEGFVLYQLGQELCGWTDEREVQDECGPAWDPNAASSSAPYPYGYWTSLQSDQKEAVRIDFYNGDVRFTSKDHIFSVRCVRK